MLSTQQVREIHNALHDPKAKSINLGGVEHPITGTFAQEGTNQCREVLVDGIRFMEQKLNKTSRFAEAVRTAKKQGKSLQITWGVKSQGQNWVLVIDGHVTNDEPNFSVRNYFIKKLGFAPHRVAPTFA